MPLCFLVNGLACKETPWVSKAGEGRTVSFPVALATAVKEYISKLLCQTFQRMRWGQRTLLMPYGLVPQDPVVKRAFFLPRWVDSSDFVGKNLTKKGSRWFHGPT
ncbi:hypothetical protein O181_123699 [Austropuccinia psidii MF-1]|uniref:Uncharacterized protein n=1 Tax=Austropuccinia psidii MF-1 TaxID=1389203 RepID=A0A9Q3Q3I5_9BASI|nr:hypothetical protein [Austropuccinia psidii MF-1]